MEKTFIARPYAKAIFDIAVSTNSLKEWDEALLILEDFSRHPDVVTLYENPTVDDMEVVNLLQSLLGNKIKDTQKNFIELLIHNRRLKSLKTISKVYTRLLNEYMSVSHVEVISSVELSGDMKKRLQEKLQKKLQCKQVELDCVIDETIIGGLIVKIDDQVIDGSVKNKISHLTKHMLN
ncbi:MAG: F0F1 ATP synthase subunit delta [Legionellales bacterium]|nr:F0F1 ATP synthase subunit delta [Legionellales bacterium]